MRYSLIVILTGALALLVLPACESTKPRGPQAKSSSIPWSAPKAGEGAGALGNMMPRRD